MGNFCGRNKHEIKDYEKAAAVTSLIWESLLRRLSRHTDIVRRIAYRDLIARCEHALKMMNPEETS